MMLGSGFHEDCRIEMSSTNSVRCFWVEKTEGTVTACLRTIGASELPAFESDSVEIAVEYSSLNYKDALASQGHPGIVRNFPHIPGIDAIGTVIRSGDDRFSTGERVLVTGNQLGVSHKGAWSERIVIPGAWALPLPEGLSPVDAMTLGTAGFTAAQCVDALIIHQVEPGAGPIAVSGATGGVGTLSVMLLAKLGFEVIAISGNLEKHDWLRSLGAADVIDRREFVDESDKPLLGSRFAGAIDAVGGTILQTLLRQTSYRGCLTACGLTGGHELHATVYPFLLRGITLCGIDSAMCPLPERKAIWEKLSGPWRLPNLSDIASIIEMDELANAIGCMMQSQVTGRTVVRVGPQASN